MSFSKIKTLVLYAQYVSTLSYYDDWKDAFVNAEEFEVDAINIWDKNNVETVQQTIQRYDFIVVLHSAIGDSIDPINPYKKALASRKAKLVSFVANEVNLPLPSSMKHKIEFFIDIEADYIATQLPLAAGQWVYEDCKRSKVVAVPHALNPDAFRPIKQQKDRKIDIGVRTHKYLPYIGDNDRNDLLNFFATNSFKPAIRLDINMRSRFERRDWAHFLNSSRGTLANEAGSFYLEKDDRTANAISDYIHQNLHKVSTDIKPINEKNFLFKIRMMAPAWLRELYKMMLGYGNAADMANHMGDDILKTFFANYQRPPVYTKAISSRHFDAIGTKTLQIMLPGRYNDILKPDVHFIELKNDYSNIEDVMTRFRDLEYRKKMVDTAYDYVIGNHTHRHRIKQVLDMATGRIV